MRWSTPHFNKYAELNEVILWRDIMTLYRNDHCFNYDHPVVSRISLLESSVQEMYFPFTVSLTSKLYVFQ